MKSLRDIKKFLNSDMIAVAGVSRDRKKFGNIIFRRMLENGINALPMNPNTDTINNHVCYRDMKSLPAQINAIVIATSKKTTERVVEEAIDKGIKNIWIQQASATKKLLTSLRKMDINLIEGRCVLMFLNPKGIHKFHKNLSKLFGQYPE